MEPGTVISITGLATTLLQWLSSAEASKAKLTVDHYLEWLRRENHEETLRALRANEGFVAELTRMIEGIKDSVFQAIMTHEAGSENRHQELIQWLDRSAALDTPRLEILTERGVEETAYGAVVSFSVVFRAVNVSRSQATIVRGEVTLLDLERELRFPVIAIGTGIPVKPNRGCASFEARTNSMPLQGRHGNLPKLLRLELKLAQDESKHTFVPADGPRLVEVEEIATEACDDG